MEKRTKHMKKWFSNKIVRNGMIVVLCVAVALISIFVVSKYATSPETYKKTIQSIDEKKATVMGVTATAAVTSMGIAAVGGEAVEPITNTIMDVSSYLLIVVCALVLEKSLLTVLGYLAFNIMIPIACLMFIIAVFAKKSILKVLSFKIVVFGLVITMIIPFSLKISDLIYETNRSQVEKLTETVQEQDSASTKKEDTKKKNWWEKVTDKVKDQVAAIVEKAKQTLNNFIDAIALFIIAYCAIPIIVFLVAVWFIKFLFNITIPLPKKEDLKILTKMKKQKLIEVKENE